MDYALSVVPGGILMKLIIGLGNPGDNYAETRHNVGFGVVSALAEDLNITPNNIKHKSLIGQGRFEGEDIILAQPYTYMNKSGLAVKALIERYQIDYKKNLIVVYDDLDLPPGTIRIKKKGSSGGHNGLKSIINCLDTKSFPRIRIGIGRPPEGVDVAEYVLDYFTSEEEQSIVEAKNEAVEAIKFVQSNSFNKAMNNFN
jgi:PTH1 family peptidyl-tRNA hydrolase